MEGLESCGGREAAGFAHLKAMKANSDTMQHIQSPRWWIEQMADILRDEDSGICFRDRYGFCSTGSQISWLPTVPDQGDRCGKVDSHFFTGASDPLAGTPYKLFMFSDPMTNNGKEETICDRDTRRLWDLWRSRALNRATVKAPLRDALSNMEEEGLSLLESDGNAGSGGQSAFAAMVQMEIELLENCST